MSSDETPPELAAEADLTVDGPAGVTRAARGAALAARAVRRLPQDHRAAERRRRDGAGRGLGARAGAADSNRYGAIVSLGWWAIAAVIGLRLGRRAETSPPIAPPARRAPSRARRCPSTDPGAILINRLWPLLLFTLLAGGLAFLAPQIPGIAAGFAIIWALAWRRQDAAVAAIEERDGASFYVRRTSPLRPMSLLRTPGFKAQRAEQRQRQPSAEWAPRGRPSMC